jgi:YtkA-like protein
LSSDFVSAESSAMLGDKLRLVASTSRPGFEPVKAEVKKGDDVVVSVRLKHKATGKPVTGAVIVQTRIDMSPDAMEEMVSPLTPVPSSDPGVYSFKTDLSMQGRWLLSIAAKAQGEPETIVGKIVFRATR